MAIQTIVMVLCIGLLGSLNYPSRIHEHRYQRANGCSDKGTYKGGKSHVADQTAARFRDHLCECVCVCAKLDFKGISRPSACFVV